MEYASGSVAYFCNDIIKYFKQKPNNDLTPMKLQKLLYFLYGTYYIKESKRLFTEDFKKWQHGPVIESVYYEFRAFGRNPITQFNKDALDRAYTIDHKTNPKYSNIFYEVMSRYGDYDAIELSNLTHEEGSPWCKAENNCVIKDEDIKEYFGKINGKQQN